MEEVNIINNINNNVIEHLNNLDKIIEILLVAHGGWHNDTICVAEQKEIKLI